MTTTIPDDDATTWRELADQLTPQQVAELEYCERENVPPGLASPQGHLKAARMMARENVIQMMCADIPAPPDAIDEPSPWDKWGDRYGRMYTAASRATGEMTAKILGVQYDNGVIERYILAYANDGSRDDGQMTAAQARQFAALLVEAADDLDRLEGAR